MSAKLATSSGNACQQLRAPLFDTVLLGAAPSPEATNRDKRSYRQRRTRVDDVVPLEVPEPDEQLAGVQRDSRHVEPHVAPVLVGKLSEHRRLIKPLVLLSITASHSGMRCLAAAVVG